MPKVPRGKRKRAYRPKSRSGCFTCKVRRVKCDETRPSCLRCTSTLRTCDGYSPVQSPDSSIVGDDSVVILAGPSIDINTCTRSRRSYGFFVQQTCPQFAGFFGSDFWERLIFQAAHHEPAIRYALVAIGSIHQHRSFGGNAEKTFAIEQYNLAIRSLLAPLSQSGERDIDVCLISCILFTCFDNIQGHHSSSGAHIRSGSKLLQETVYDRETGMLQHHILGNKNLVNLYAPLESIATILAAIGDTPVATILRDYKANAYEQYFPGMNGNGESFSFNSIEEARNAFDYGRYLFTSSDLKHLQCVPATVALTMEGHIANLTAMTSIFSDGLNAFVKKRSTSLTPKEEMAAAVLQLHVLNTYVSLHLEHSPPSCRPQSDQFHSQMIEMVSLGDRIVSAISSSSVLGESATTFCLDMGYIIPLYTVASQCHDPPLRRRAIALLRMASRQEGLWNSLQVARAAERIMEIEEGENVLLQPFTPDAAQSIVLRPSTILQLSSNSLRLQYVLQKDGVTVSHGVVEELFQW